MIKIDQLNALKYFTIFLHVGVTILIKLSNFGGHNISQ